MAFARDPYTASASQTDFTITFSYLDEDDVLVYEDGVLKTVTTDYTLPNATTVRFNSGLVGGEVIVLQRSTSQSTRLVDYTAGALSESELDADSLQAFYMAQESVDIASTALPLGTDNNWDAGAKLIKDLGTPVATTDAVTKAYVDAITVAAGNVPTPTDPGEDGYSLVALDGSFTWQPGPVSDVADATEGPTFEVYRNSASPADADLIGVVAFPGEDSADNKEVYAKIVGRIDDTTSTTEDGGMNFWGVVAGTLTKIFWTGLGMVVGAPTGGDQGAGSINCETLFVGGVAVTAGAVSELQDEWIPAGAMTSRVTNGAASGLTEHATNDIMMRTFDFDPSTEEGVQFVWSMPKRYDAGTITFTPVWTSPASSGTVKWDLHAGALADTVAIDQALGTAVGSTDSFFSTDYVHVGPTSAAITIANAAPNVPTVFEITRDVATDTLTVDAKLIGITVHWTADATSDD